MSIKWNTGIKKLSCTLYNGIAKVLFSTLTINKNDTIGYNGNYLGSADTTKNYN